MKNTYIAIIAILVILAGVTWYMFLQKSKPAVSDIEKTSSNTEYKTYTDGNISFQYPKEWNLVTFDNNDEDVFNPDVIMATSVDFVEGEGNMGSLRAGYQLIVNIGSLDIAGDYSLEKKVQAFTNAVTQCGNPSRKYSYEIITVANSSTLLSNKHDCSEGSEYVIFRSNDRPDAQYSFALGAVDVFNPEVRNLMKSILATVKIK